MQQRSSAWLAGELPTAGQRALGCDPVTEGIAARVIDTDLATSALPEDFASASFRLAPRVQQGARRRAPGERTRHMPSLVTSTTRMDATDACSDRGAETPTQETPTLLTSYDRNWKRSRGEGSAEDSELSMRDDQQRRPAEAFAEV